jgi:hypothetical protein
MGYETGSGNYIMGIITLAKGKNAEAAGHLRKAPKSQFPYRDLYLSIALRNCGKTKAADEAFRSFVRQYRAPFAVSVLARNLSGNYSWRHK